MSDLAVTGGTVLVPGGAAQCDVFLTAGRIVGVVPVVGTREAGLGIGGRTESGTVGAGAERSAVGATTGSHAAPVTGDTSPAAGAPAAGPRPRLDATGLLVAPGFVDLQCNGAVGVDLASAPERLWEVAAALPRWGVTAWLPTLVSSPAAVRRRLLDTLRVGPPAGEGPVAVPLGVHLEGPFLAPERAGAHDPAQLRPPSPELVAGEGWSAEAGVALVTLAPELPGALAVTSALVERGVVVAAGHSSATAAQATAAVDDGVRYVTHLFNAMAPLHHREPGLVGVALTDERLVVGLIADGLHVAPAVVALAARALGERLSLVSDAVAALGAPGGGGHDQPGREADQAVSRLAGRPVAVSGVDGSVRLADGTLAGSTLSLDRAVRNLTGFAGVRLPAAAATSTSTPAALLGDTGRGTITPGARGDLVLLTPAGEVVATVIGGRVVHDRRRPDTGGRGPRQ